MSMGIRTLSGIEAAMHQINQICRKPRPSFRSIVLGTVSGAAILQHIGARRFLQLCEKEIATNKAKRAGLILPKFQGVIRP